MPDEKREYGLLISVLLTVIFLCLTIIGACVILYVWGHDDNAHEYSSTGMFWQEFYIDGALPGYQPAVWHAQNGSFSGVWAFSDDTDPPRDDSCLLLALVDDMPIPMYFNGTLADSHLLRFRAPVSANISFNLTGLQEGFHDVILLSLRNPYADPLTVQGHVFPRRPDLDARLFNVVVGNDTRPDMQYNQGPLEQYAAYKNGSDSSILGYGPWLTYAPFVDRMRPDGGMPSGEEVICMDAAPGQAVKYYINVKNGVGQEYERYGRFALLQLLDYEQVPIRADVPVYVYNATLDPGTFFAMPASIKAPASPGAHVLTLVLITYPFENGLDGKGRVTSVTVDSVVLNVTG